ncbi:hypothetical protein Btru_072608 [Bulinus truncatus]|nr:hypothetical protein Btru_072608 [Bulinus truncatus]
MKLIVRLKEFTKDISDSKAKKFVCSLLNAVEYDECLLIDVDDDLAKLIGRDLKLLKKNITGVLKADEISDKLKTW